MEKKKNTGKNLASILAAGAIGLGSAAGNADTTVTSKDRVTYTVKSGDISWYDVLERREEQGRSNPLLKILDGNEEHKKEDGKYEYNIYYAAQIADTYRRATGHDLKPAQDEPYTIEAIIERNSQGEPVSYRWAGTDSRFGSSK